MANRLKVEDLRTQLAQRGLDTTGTKPTLVQRLEKALRNEAKDAQSNAATDNKKRPRDLENGDSSNLPEKVKAMETFGQMGIRRLRTLRGVSASGSKKELLERLGGDDSEKEPEEVTEAMLGLILLQLREEATRRGFSADDSEKEPEEIPTDKEEVQAVGTFHEMGIGQLLKEATHRGISAEGSKKELLERLCADDSQKEPEVVPKEDKEEVEAVQKFREMGIAQLRKEATLRGISANGSKKELLERLCADDSKKESQQIPEDKDVKSVERFREMGIGQLRKEATLRGISATGSKNELLERLCADSEKESEAVLEGTKPSLVQRLEEALSNESERTQSNTATDNRKRPRESENGDSSNLPKKVKAIETFRQMGIRQFSEEATLRGVSASGSKKELLERLCADDSGKEPEEVTEEVKDIERFREMGIAQLRKEATRRGVSAGGSRKELLERLCADDSQNEPEEVPQVYVAVLNVGDSSNQSTDNVATGSTSRPRVASGYSEVGKPVKKLRFNEHGLPIGDKSKAATRLGNLARKHIPICFRGWKHVPTLYKDRMWNVYKDDYPEVRDCQRNIFMNKARNAWRNYKEKLRKTLVGDDVAKWKEQIPELVNSEDWDKFCAHEATQYQKDLRRMNKEIRNNCKRKNSHNTGRGGYAQAAEKWEEKHGRPPTRAELWLDTHLRKDGTYAPHDKEFAERISVLLRVSQENGEEETLDSGPLCETFGPEKGPIRCIGSNISRRTMLASAFAREMLIEVNTDHDKLATKVDNLTEEMEGFKSTFQEFIRDLKDGNSASAGHIVPTTACTIASPSVGHPPSKSPSTSLNDLTPCEILSHTWDTVGYGRKSKVGAATLVHGHSLRPREVRVILDTIKMPTYPVWGGKQGGCNTLEDVGKGGLMYWHDDFLPTIDDTH